MATLPLNNIRGIFAPVEIYSEQRQHNIFKINSCIIELGAMPKSAYHHVREILVPRQYREFQLGQGVLSDRETLLRRCYRVNLAPLARQAGRLDLAIPALRVVLLYLVLQPLQVVHLVLWVLNCNVFDIANLTETANHL